MKYLLKLLAIVVFSLTAVNAGDFLMPDEAFKPYAKVNDKMQIETGVSLGKDIYLYAKKLTIEIKDSSLSILKKESPSTSEHSGEQVYLTSPNFVISLENKEALKGMQDLTLVLSYQGCSEMGLCYNPYTKEYPLSLDASKLPTTSSLQKVEKKIVTERSKVEKEIVELSETDAIADTIKSGNIVVVLLTFLGFGLLLAMTPCVFPMIPIISGVIVSQGEGLTTKKAFALSIVYVLAMAVAYTIAGVLAGLFGANLQAALQMPWVIYSFSFVFVALAFSMFGYYELKLPDSLVAKVSSGGERGGYAGVAIISSYCWSLCCCTSCRCFSVHRSDR